MMSLVNDDVIIYDVIIDYVIIDDAIVCDVISVLEWYVLV